MRRPSEPRGSAPSLVGSQCLEAVLGRDFGENWEVGVLEVVVHRDAWDREVPFTTDTLQLSRASARSVGLRIDPTVGWRIGIFDVRLDLANAGEGEPMRMKSSGLGLRP